MMIRSYSGLIELNTFDERFNYLRLDGVVGQQTFGFDRYLNQMFYTSPRWRRLRNEIILRDEACDLACHDYEIFDRIYIHHMNPITEDDIIHDRSYIYDPEFLICTSRDTHLAIHYGNENLLSKEFVERKPGDTIPWK